MTFQLVLIEDDDRLALAARIKNLGSAAFKVEPLAPPIDLNHIESVLSLNPDLLLIDYELDSTQPDSSIANYRGTTLAARVREENPNLPIVLLTRSNLGAWLEAQRTVEAGSTFDDILYKEEGLRDRPNDSHAKLLSLARGYKTLREIEDRTLEDLLDVLETDEEGRGRAREAQPPSARWAAFEAANWIRFVLLRYPGVLYSDAHAATSLGVTIRDFRNEAMQQLMRNAKYQGPFCEEVQRWWRHALFDEANRLSFHLDDTVGFREGFRLAASEKLGLDLEPARDIETNIAPADTVCYFLDIPVRIETSLPYLPDARPPIMEPARISFRAIRERNDVEDMYIDAASRPRLEDIRRGLL